ncbi:hypothetical protein TNCV_4750741 [Trichonephila clavipes]|nr:hypothetical protein TNCV_4750741 [Trichonephila clavipes]
MLLVRLFRWWIHTCDGWVDAPCNHTYLMTKHIPVHDCILIDFQVIHNECIHALAEPISGQTQDNSHTKLAFAKPSALSYTPNDVVGIIFRLAVATSFIAKSCSFLLLQTHIFFTLWTFIL